jgi:hypothetical protein
MASGDARSPARFSTGIADAGTPVTTDGDTHMLRKTLYGILVVLPLAGGLAACDDQGPMEEAGEEIDEAADSTSNMFEDGPAEEMGEDIDEATGN